MKITTKELKTIIKEVIEEGFNKFPKVETSTESTKYIDNRIGSKKQYVFEYFVDSKRVSKSDFYIRYSDVKDVTKDPFGILQSDIDSMLLRNGDQILSTRTGFMYTVNRSDYSKRILGVTDLNSAYTKYLDLVS